MELSLSDYFIPSIQSIDDLNVFRENAVLWVLYADKTPPHVGISSDGNYFSLKANGKDQSVSISSIIDIVQRKKIKTLCFQLKSCLSTEMLTTSFETFHKTIPNRTTCLDPIKIALALDKPEKLTELLNILYAQQSIIKTYGFHIDPDFSGIKNYSVADIHTRLNKLKND